MNFFRLIIRQSGVLGLIAAVLVLPFPAAMAADNPATEPATGYEDVLSGFDQSGPPSGEIRPSTGEEADAASRWDLSGAATLSSVWNVGHEAPDPAVPEPGAPEPVNTDYRGLSRLRTELDLELEVDLSDSWRCQVGGRGFYDFAYHIQGHSDFTREVLDEYEDELEFRETYIEGNLLPNLDIKAGRQIVIWGNSETFRVTDILNPLDNRDPGLVDIEDLRLPVCMARMDYHWRASSGYYDLTGIVIPEQRFNKEPVFGNDFFPFDMPLPHEEIPGQSFENSDYALAVKGVFQSWDLSLYGASYYNDDPYMNKIGVQSIPIQLPDGSVMWQQYDVYERQHARLWMTGLAANVAMGDWLLKTELARSDGYKYAAAANRKAQTRGLAGCEYMGFTDKTLTLEFMQTAINGFEHAMRSLPDYADSSQFQTAFRFTQDLMHDRLELVLVAIVMGVDAKEGLIERLTAAYDITDNLTVTGGCIFYQDGKETALFDGIHDNNRVFIDLKYSF